MEITLTEAQRITNEIAGPLYAQLEEFSREQVDAFTELATDDDHGERFRAVLHFADHVRETLLATLDVRVADIPVDGSCEDVEVVDEEEVTTHKLDLAGDDPEGAIAEAEALGLTVGRFTTAGSGWPAVRLTGHRDTVADLLAEWGYDANEDIVEEGQ